MTYPQRLQATFQELSRLVLARETVRSTLDVISHLAVQTIPGCEIASVSLVSHEDISTVGVSDNVAYALDAIQYETGEGPCLDAITKDAMWFRVDDMKRDTTWPAFSAKARDQGVESLLAFTLRIDQDTLGALNLYARSAGSFADQDVDEGAIYAAHAAVVLAKAQSRAVASETLEELDNAFVSQEIIARALGILMEKEFRSSEEALIVLEGRAEQLNMKLGEVARNVITDADHERAALHLPDGFRGRLIGRVRRRSGEGVNRLIYRRGCRGFFHGPR
jgi:transcriptional regulator with GAF, ATPase, and Fis domain